MMIQQSQITGVMRKDGMSLLLSQKTDVARDIQLPVCREGSDRDPLPRAPGHRNLGAGWTDNMNY